MPTLPNAASALIEASALIVGAPQPLMYQAFQDGPLESSGLDTVIWWQRSGDRGLAKLAGLRSRSLAGLRSSGRSSRGLRPGNLSGLQIVAPLKRHHVVLCIRRYRRSRTGRLMSPHAARKRAASCACALSELLPCRFVLHGLWSSGGLGPINLAGLQAEAPRIRQPVVLGCCACGGSRTGHLLSRHALRNRAASRELIPCRFVLMVFHHLNLSVFVRPADYELRGTSEQRRDFSGPPGLRSSMPARLVMSEVLDAIVAGDPAKHAKGLQPAQCSPISDTM
jgi:hypothetical protein